MTLRLVAHRAARRAKRRLRVLKGVASLDDVLLPAVFGVIHVGANTGQERELYATYGLRVLWIEPATEEYPSLERNLASYPLQRAAQALVAATDGEPVTFHTADNSGLSSSMLELAQHMEMFPDVAYEGSIPLTTSTLPTVLAEAGADIGDYDGLVLDTQGSELLVLEGAVPLLAHFGFIKTEVADFEAYRGCCQLPELEAFMAVHGFQEHRRQLQASHAGLGTYYDVLYRRRERAERD